MTEFAIGDVVRLKAGGPEMTVTRPLDSDGEVCAQWTEGDGKEVSTYHRPFLAAELVLVRTADEEFERNLDDITAEPKKEGMEHPDFLKELEKHANRPQPRPPTNRDNFVERIFGNKPRT